MPKTTQEQIESRSIFVISFIFLFRYVTERDLSLLGKEYQCTFYEGYSFDAFEKRP